MKQPALMPIKKIIATEPQALINLKLRYNALVDKINSEEMPEGEKEQLLQQINLLNSRINL
jgi:hypothetical protein